jgi:FMN-dependent oxidoreductase (nitrilotriacetate monooxygenase family)
MIRQPDALMKLFVFLHYTGGHPGGWRYPGAGVGRLHDFAFYREIAEAAEAAKFDALFLGDAQGYQQIAGRDAFCGSDTAGKLEPMTLLAALAVATRRIGLMGTVSTTYNEPYAIARRMASIDHISGGRAGWNVVTSTTLSEALNFGLDALIDHDLRYERAEECVDVVKALWDSWDDDAFLCDAASGRYSDPDKVRALDHVGRFFKVKGPLNIARPPQGHPVIVQAGASGPGQRLCARTADLAFTAQPTFAGAQTFYAGIKEQARQFGRDPSNILVVPALQLLVRGTEAEAKAAERELLELIPHELAISRLQMLLGGFDLAGYDLDGPLPEIPLAAGNQSVQQKIVAMARTQNLTIRALSRSVSVSRTAWSMAGAPEQIADMLQQWFENGAADGFSLTPPYLPGSFTDFTEQVVPILQKRGLFREEYEGETLRDNLGLPRPPRIFNLRPEMGGEPAIWARPRGPAMGE